MPMTRAMPAVAASKAPTACPSVRVTAATRAEAAPPKPLSMATVWGISIIFTFLARTAPATAAGTRPIRSQSHLPEKS